MKHKPNCSTNISCTVYHENGGCNHYKKCDCGAELLQESNKEEKIITCKTCGENCKGYCFDTKEDRDWKEEMKMIYGGTVPQGAKIDLPYLESFIEKTLTSQLQKERETAYRAGRNDFMKEIQHEQTRLLDGFAHPTDCVECLSIINKQ